MKAILLVFALSLGLTAAGPPPPAPPIPPQPWPKGERLSQAASVRTWVADRALQRIKKRLLPKAAAVRSVPMVKPLRYPMKTPRNAQHKVFWLDLPVIDLGELPPYPERVYLHTEIDYINDVPVVYWETPVISDIVTIAVLQPAGAGVVTECSSDMRTWTVTASWGPTSQPQRSTFTWIRPDQDIQDFYPKMFFRSFQY